MENIGLEWMIAAGMKPDEIDRLLTKERNAKEICDLYEQKMGYNPLPWTKLARLKRFLVTKTPEEIQTFAAWSRKDYSTFTPAKARQFPDMVIDLWPQAFLTKIEPESTYDLMKKRMEAMQNVNET